MEYSYYCISVVIVRYNIMMTEDDVSLLMSLPFSAGIPVT